MIQSSNTTNISFLLPTRSRTENLKKMFESLYETSYDKNSYEIVLIFDSDDTDHINSFISFHKPFKHTAIIMERVGYYGLHHYYNAACKLAKGNWLWLWNDDCTEMLEPNWDLIIKEYNNQFLVLNPFHKDFSSSKRNEIVAEFLSHSSMFPIVPKKYVEILGYFAPWNHLDTYTNYIAKTLNILKNEYRIQHVHTRVIDEVLENVEYHKYPLPVDQLQKDIKKISNYLLNNMEKKI
jgi:hypothetical protein